MDEQRGLRRALWVLGLGLGLAWAWWHDEEGVWRWASEMLQGQAMREPPPAEVMERLLRQTLAMDRATRVTLRAVERGACQTRRPGEWRCELTAWLDCPQGEQPVRLAWFAQRTRDGGWQQAWPDDAHVWPARQLGLQCQP